jgi:hypothetical protein
MSNLSRPCLTIIATAALLVACSTPYVVPENGTLSDVTIKIKPSRITQFSLAIYDNAETCSGAKELLKETGRNGEIAQNGLKTKIKANQLATFNYREVEGRYVCTFNFSFVPQSGQTYLLTESTINSSCRINVVDNTDVNKPIKVPLIRRSVSGNDCTPINPAELPPSLQKNP